MAPAARRLLTLFFLFFGATLVASNVMATGTPGARVQKAPAEITRRTFPRGQPPSGLPEANRGEAAWCDTRFGSAVQIEGETRTGIFGPAEVQVVGVLFEINLRVVIWTPEGETQKYIAHEETHRAISEYYYAKAEAVAQRLADEAMKRNFKVDRRTPNEVIDARLAALQNDMIAAYLRENHERCKLAQELFDEITDHGRAPISNVPAMQRALADENAHWQAAEVRRRSTSEGTVGEPSPVSTPGS